MSTNVDATQDTYTWGVTAGDNFEGNNELLVNGGTHRAYSYIEFDLSSFAGKIIENGAIKLFIVANNLTTTSDTDIRFYRIDESWDASEATFNESPHVTDHNAKRKTISPTDIGWKGCGITDIVQDIIDNGGYGIRVEIDADVEVWFSSIEGGNSPKLVITEAPTTCSQSFTASADIGDLPFHPYFNLYKGTTFVGQYQTPKNLTLDIGDTYMAEPLVPDGQEENWTAPDNVTFVACTTAIDFVYVETAVSPRLPPCNAPDGIGYGDIDGDGYVTVDDSLYVSRHVIFGEVLYPLTDAQKVRADVDGDGEITQPDALLINKYATYVEGYDTFPVCEVPIVPAVTCDGNSPNYGTGCDLLNHYDADDDDIISDDEFYQAMYDQVYAIITQEEYDFVVAAYNAGSINALCEGCYVVPCPDPSVSDIIWNRSPAKVNQEISFWSTSSAGEGETISSYEWDWGDGSTHGTGATPYHYYTTAGTYEVTLIVTNSCGKTASRTEPITVAAAPICTPGTKKCVGNDVYQCNAAGSAWVYVETCAHGCSGGVCSPPPVTTPVITSIGTDDPPKLCEPIRFVNTVIWNDAGGTRTQKVYWEYTKDTAEYTGCGDELSWTRFSTAQWPEHTFTETDADITHIRCIVENKHDNRACAMIENFTFEATNGFVISIGADLVGKELFVGKVYQIPLTDVWFWFAMYGFVETIGTHAQWDSLAEGTYYKIKVGVDACDFTPAPNKIVHYPFGDVPVCDGIFSDGDYVAIQPGDLGTCFVKGEDVYQISGSSVKCIHKISASVDPVYELFGSAVCNFFSISEEDCPLFLTEMCSDMIFVSNQLSIITEHKDMYGEDHPPEWYDYPLLGLGVFGILSPGICEGALLKSVGKKITSLIDQVKRFPADFTEARHGNFIVGFLKGDGDGISAMVDAYKAQDWANFDKAYYDIITNPIALIDQLKRARRWLDEIYKRGYGKSSIDDVARRPLEAQMGLIVDYLATPLRYRFIKPDNLEVIEELFKAGMVNAARHETLTATQSAAILQMAHNNPECFAKAVAELSEVDYNALIAVLKKSGATTEHDVVKYAWGLFNPTSGYLHDFDHLSGMLVHTPLAVLTGTSDEIAEALIREFPTLTGERCLAEMSLLSSHFKTHYPGVVDAAVNNLATTKGWSAFHARKVIEEGKLGWVIKERIKSVPEYAIANPLAITKGIIAWHMVGIAPMWFIEEVPQGYSIQVYTFVKREEYDLARVQLASFKNLLDGIEDRMLTPAKLLFPAWAIYMDTAMQAHWDQYHGYARYLGVETIEMPEVKETLYVYVDEIMDANTFYTGIDPAETWRDDIGGWLAHKGSDPLNAAPEVPVLYQATFTEVFVAQGEHYEPQLVKRKEFGEDETRWTVGSGEDKTLHNAIIEWQNTNIEDKKLTLLSDVNCQWDGENRIKACVKSGTTDLNKDLIIQGYAAIWFLGCPEGEDTENKQIAYEDYRTEETTAKDAGIGIWAEAVVTGTVKCTSNQIGFAVYIDGVYIDHSYGNTYLVIENVQVGERIVKIEKGDNYDPPHCEETIIVAENEPAEFDCQMTKIVELVGSIKCTSNQAGFAVYVDGVYIDHSYGNTYLVVLDVKVGPHTVKIEKGSGYTPTHCEKTATVIVEGTVTVDCQMVKDEPAAESTTLSIGCPVDANGNAFDRCWDFEIWVGSKLTKCKPPHTFNFGSGVHCDCTSPYNLIDCELGTHTITVKKYGFDDVSKTITLVEDTPVSWTPVMQLTTADKGSILCQTTPQGAAIWIARSYRGDTNKTIEDLPAGATVVTFKKIGYDDCAVTVTVMKDSTVTASCTLVVEAEEHDVSFVVPAGATVMVETDGEWEEVTSTTTIGRLSTILRGLRSK